MQDEQFRERLAHDAASWRRDGLITERQERAILARYGAGAPAVVRALRMGWAVTAASVVGALVLAAGVVLLFASSWESLPDAFRTAIVIGAMLLAYGAGYLLIERFDLQRIGSAFLLLGVLLYQAGLFLLAQIYNMPVMPVESPILLLLGALGALPLAYLFGSRIILLLALADAVLWLVFELSVRYPDAPESYATLVIVAVMGIGYYAIGRLHQAFRALAHFADVYIFSGALVLLGLVYVFTFDEVWREIIDGGIESYAAPAGVYIAVTLVAVLAVSQLRLQRVDADRAIDLGAQLALLGLAVVVATWPAWTGYAVIFNAVYFSVSFALVSRGYVSGDERYVNFGLVAFGIGLVTRYIDVFWSLLAGSAFFLVGGVLLLGLAFAIERLRRELLRGMRVGVGDAFTSGPGEVPV